MARKADPDRFFCAMFLPESIREAGFVLIAFNHELTRALSQPVSASIAGPLAGLIRLQWWRDVVEGRRERHDVAAPLADLLDQARIRRETLLAAIDAREEELRGLSDWSAWRQSMRAGAGGIQRAFGEMLGVADEAVLDQLAACGAAFATGTLIRHLPSVLQSGRYPLPEEALTTLGLTRDDLAEALSPEMQNRLVALLREEGANFLRDAAVRSLPGTARLASLPAVLAARDLRRESASPGAVRGVGDRLAVTLAGIRARM